MSPEHKQALRANRDILVDNMTPDDIFNDLISKHILTNADVSRIKDKNTIEAMNEVRSHNHPVLLLLSLKEVICIYIFEKI